MSHFTVIGINHKTAPIEVREKFYLNAVERELLLSELKNHPAVYEAIVLSTCNRTEIYVHLMENKVEMIWNIVADVKNLRINAEMKSHFFAFHQEEAVQHLLQVACGLDSLIVGEKQILGQLKEAIDLSRGKGMLGRAFNILSLVAVRAGKKARTMTQIDIGGSSISWAAVVMAQKKLKTLNGKSVLVIGAGKMGKLATRHLKEKGVEHLYISNRTCRDAQELAQETGCTAIGFWEIREVLTKIDVCICSVSAPHYIIEKNLVEKSMIDRQGKPLIFIDISMPRNINPDVAEVPNAELVSIDELDKVLEDTMAKRFEAVQEVESIIQTKKNEFYSKLNKNRAQKSAEFINPAFI